MQKWPTILLTFTNRIYDGKPAVHVVLGLNGGCNIDLHSKKWTRIRRLAKTSQSLPIARNFNQPCLLYHRQQTALKVRLWLYHFCSFLVLFVPALLYRGIVYLKSIQLVVDIKSRACIQLNTWSNIPTNSFSVEPKVARIFWTLFIFFDNFNNPLNETAHDR